MNPFTTIYQESHMASHRAEGTMTPTASACLSNKRRRSCATDKRTRFREVDCPAAGVKAEIPAVAVCLRTGQTRANGSSTSAIVRIPFIIRVEIKRRQSVNEPRFAVSFVIGKDTSRRRVWPARSRLFIGFTR